MSIPVILLAGGLETVGLFRQPQEIDWPAMIFGTLLSGLSAYLCIHYFLVLIKKIGMQPFVVYRVVSRGIRGLVALVFHFQEQDGLRALLAGCLGVVLFGLCRLFGKRPAAGISGPLEGIIFGSFYQLTVADLLTQGQARKLEAGLVEELERVDQAMSTYRPLLMEPPSTPQRATPGNPGQPRATRRLVHDLGLRDDRQHLHP